jgi:ABC-type Fe3+/spermidine/putrescine transport system ATPase subunit
MTSVTLSHLSKDYSSRAGVVHALRDVSLQVESGELMALLGPSGSGKTTLLRLVAGLLDPSRGDVAFNDESVLRVPAEKRGAVMVFQQHSLFPFMSVQDNVAFGLKMRRVERSEIARRVGEAMALVRLAGYESRWADELSGGQRQRVALARALVVRPKLLLLDEPLGDLDPELRGELRDEIMQLQQRLGITTLFVTHDQSEAVAVAGRIALIIHGTLVQVGAPRDFYERPADARVARFFGGLNIMPGRKQGTVVETACGPLTINPSLLPDGPVLMSIRPEAVQFGPNGANTLTGTVTAFAYQGDSASCRVSLGGTEVHIAVPPFASHVPGEQVALHFPREHIWLMPVEGNS